MSIPLFCKLPQLLAISLLAQVVSLSGCDSSGTGNNSPIEVINDNQQPTDSSSPDTQQPNSDQNENDTGGLQDLVTFSNGVLVAGPGSTDQQGFTLYVFDGDLRRLDSACYGGCAQNWPPYIVNITPPQMADGLGIIYRDNGDQQLTLDGRPLYFYQGDAQVGDKKGQGLSNVWWVVADSFGENETGNETGNETDNETDSETGNETDTETDPTDNKQNTAELVPLFNQDTLREPEIKFDRGDAIITRLADRGRDRHARDHGPNDAHDHYLAHYWEHRTAQIEIVDYVAKGGSTIEVNFVSEWKLGAREFRAWYRGINTPAEYFGNYENSVSEEGPGRYDENLLKVSDQGDQYKYSITMNKHVSIDGHHSDFAKGQRMEIEISQFLDEVPEGRENYYGTTYLYRIGEGGMAPWFAYGDFETQSFERGNSHEIDQKGWLGGATTLHYQYSQEPENHFMQMATNLSNINGQPFVMGRRVHHTHFSDGHHDESEENGLFNELAGKSGPNYVNTSCASCHDRNGRALVADDNQPLNKWVFKVGATADGEPDPRIGNVLQPSYSGVNPQDSEGTVSISHWTEHSNGLRSPNYVFSKGEPAFYSARLAPKLVGLGLLEAVAESTIVEWQDKSDLNQDGISGKAQISSDPETGVTRLGRFGWKAGASSLRHQIAGALNTDMGVMTSVKPKPDCGTAQTTCGEYDSELSEEHFDQLVKYNSLLGVRARRDLDNATALAGEQIFSDTGCLACHRDTMVTGAHHPFAELRNQTIHPYSDMLLHDMGEGLADNLNEGQASGAEWRTTPLWGLGLSAGVSKGENLLEGESYLHDGRARNLHEAILWHGGESQASTDKYEKLSDQDKTALMKFLKSI